MRPGVAVIGGGANVEHAVSLASARAIADALDPARWRVVRLTIGRDGAWCLGDDRITLADAVAIIADCAAVIPAVHGPHGEDGTLAALCDLAVVPCVGSGVGAGAVGMDKWVAKQVAVALGIGVAAGELITPHTTPPWPGPAVVKPVTAGSSNGVTLVDRREVWEPALHAAFALDRRVLVEEVVCGREVDVAVLGRPDGGRTVAPLLEIVTEGIFDLGTKYGGAADFRVPAALTDPERATLERAAVRMYDALGCAGVARLDFFLTAAGPVFNEVNTMPGFTPQSQVPRMFAAAGTSYADLVETLVRDAISSAAAPCP